MGRMLTGQQSSLVLLLLIATVASVIAISATVLVPGQHDIVEVTLMDEGWNPDHRARRDADSNLPDRLTFAVPVASDLAVLTMTRSRLLPVVMSDENSTRAANSFCEGAAVYTDLVSQSTLIVKRESGDYMLRGSFVHGNVAWRLQHETRHKRDTGNDTGILHRISHLVSPKTTSFVGDTEELPGAQTHRSNSGDGTPQQDRNDTEKPAQHVVEIAFIVDYADYVKWVKYVGVEATLREMRLWYTFVAESVNVRYQNIKDPDIAIRTTVTILRILNSPEDEGLFSNRTHIDNVMIENDGLENFQEWYIGQDDIPASDHYMLFTGLNLTGNAFGDLSGIAYIGVLCFRESISICENDFNENVGHTAAHELAHSLSAEHDEDVADGDGCVADYVMAASGTPPLSPANEGNNWLFSPCSIRSFKSLLENVTCTRETTLETTALPAPIPGKRAGEVLSPDAQCRLTYQNRTSYFCKEVQADVDSTGLESLCRGMLCFNPDDNECYYATPLDYTPCADDKWCVSGKCTVKTEQHTTTSSMTNHTASTAATTVAQPSSTSTMLTATATTTTTTTTKWTPTSNSSQNVNNITIATSNATTTPSTTSTITSRLSTLTSSETAVVFVTFGLCLLLLSVL